MLVDRLLRDWPTDIGICATVTTPGSNRSRRKNVSKVASAPTIGIVRAIGMAESWFFQGMGISLSPSSFGFERCWFTIRPILLKLRGLFGREKIGGIGELKLKF